MALRTIGSSMDPPQISFSRSQDGTIQAVTIDWHLYGITVGPESYGPGPNAWYVRKRADGVYLWYLFK